MKLINHQRQRKHWQGTFTMHLLSPWLSAVDLNSSAVAREFFMRTCRPSLSDDPVALWPRTPDMHTGSTWCIVSLGRREARLRSVQPSRPKGTNLLLERIFFSSQRSSPGTRWWILVTSVPRRGHPHNRDGSFNIFQCARSRNLVWLLQ